MLGRFFISAYRRAAVLGHSWSDMSVDPFAYNGYDSCKGHSFFDRDGVWDRDEPYGGCENGAVPWCDSVMMPYRYFHR